MIGAGDGGIAIGGVVFFVHPVDDLSTRGATTLPLFVSYVSVDPGLPF
jgi:hypothetical protein